MKIRIGRAAATAFTLLIGVAAWAGAAPMDVLTGRWVRPDGDYMLVVKVAAPDGTLDAAYANPRPMPFSIARARRMGNTITVFLELRAGGYGGSTYTLAYDPASDSLKGVYHQAVTGRDYVVVFRRMP